jgi:hypothetical protein
MGSWLFILRLVAKQRGGAANRVVLNPESPRCGWPGIKGRRNSSGVDWLSSARSEQRTVLKKRTMGTQNLHTSP